MRASLLNELGYAASPNYLRRDNGTLDRDYGHAHLFRKAASKCGLHGAYVLRPETGETVVPVVYVCEAKDEAGADRIHKLVWNQNIVPFLLVTTRHSIRLYSGFRYHTDPEEDDDTRGVIKAAVTFRRVADELPGFFASAIDSGAIWREWGDRVTPGDGVDWTLLRHLDKLDLWLRENGLDRETSHALIGRYVYLRYLRDREILSTRKLDRWGIDPSTVFSRHATLDGFWTLTRQLDAWLNGEVFPIGDEARSSVQPSHLAKVAGTFVGDDPETGQLHLDFTAFDFSFLPIEVMSAIYQQFLHAGDEGAEQPTRGKEVGAYYTPIPLVNFVLDELDDRRPLCEGMKVLDPSCGSGAFLVQCYRRLVERHLADNPGRRPDLTELRSLLEKHIFGVDRDPDACRVAELSLILTLLDYAEPPDLEVERGDGIAGDHCSGEEFKLPVLHNRNIFHADFFDRGSCWALSMGGMRFDWIIGNPPWKTIARDRRSSQDEHAWQWIGEHIRRHPVGGHQIAEAFAWEVMRCATPDSVIGLLLPAMTLFNDESRRFREAFFRQARVWCIANFANFAYVLFAGRSQCPAAAFFYYPRAVTGPGASDRTGDSSAVPDSETLLYYAPLLANQLANRPSRPGRPVETWSIVVNAGEVRSLATAQVANGDMLPWKTGMWGSPRDQHILCRLGRRWPTLQDYAERHRLEARQGFPLRPKAPSAAGEAVEFAPELVGQWRVKFRALLHCGLLFTFPSDALYRIRREQAYMRKRSGRAGLAVSYPPHIIVDAARRFAVYSDDFIAVQQPHLGIAGAPESSAILKALSLYLSSDFALYHQFFTSPEWGINVTRATRESLMRLPVPLDTLSPRRLRRWVSLHEALVRLDSENDEAEDFSLCPPGDAALERPRLLAQLNALVYDVLQLSPSERWNVEDFVRVQTALLKGKIGDEALGRPSPDELSEYAEALKSELDAFVSGHSALRHTVTLVHSQEAAMVGVDLGMEAPQEPAVLQADAAEARELNAAQQRLLHRHSQWVYFNRTLRVYEGSRVYVLKPFSRMHWTKSQAVLDAGEIVAETITGMGT
jgi:hypothetical protein